MTRLGRALILRVRNMLLQHGRGGGPRVVMERQSATRPADKGAASWLLARRKRERGGQKHDAARRGGKVHCVPTLDEFVDRPASRQPRCRQQSYLTRPNLPQQPMAGAKARPTPVRSRALLRSFRSPEPAAEGIVLWVTNDTVVLK